MTIVSKMMQVFALGVAVTIAAMGENLLGKTQAATAQGSPLTISFSAFPVGPLPQTFQIASITFVGHGPDNNVKQGLSPDERMYNFTNSGMSIVLPMEAESIEFRFCTQKDDLIEIDALNSAGDLLLKQQVQPQTQCQDIELQYNSISIVRITGGGGEGAIVHMHVHIPRE